MRECNIYRTSLKLTTLTLPAKFELLLLTPPGSNDAV